MWKIKQIFDGDYGCEELKPGEDPKLSVTLISDDGKVDFEDKTFLNHITGILKENKNSKKSVLEVSQICGDKLAEFKIKNYRFVESNHLNSKVLAESGDFTKAEDVSVATRNFDGYSYTLYVW